MELKRKSKMNNFPGPLRSFTVKKNHIGSCELRDSFFYRPTDIHPVALLKLLNKNLSELVALDLFLPSTSSKPEEPLLVASREPLPAASKPDDPLLAASRS